MQKKVCIRDEALATGVDSVLTVEDEDYTCLKCSGFQKKELVEHYQRKSAC